MKRKMSRRNRRIKRMKRILLAVVAIVMSIYFGVSANVETAPVEYEEVFVEYGDSFWSIAVDHATEETDIRKFVYQIKKFNDMTDSDLVANTVIKVPLYR